MAKEQTCNNGIGVLAAGIDAAVTSLVLTSVTGLPTAAPFNIRVDAEILRVTAVNAGTKTYTVTRGAEGTTAATHAAAANVFHPLTLAGLKRWNEQLLSGTAVANQRGLNFVPGTNATIALVEDAANENCNVTIGVAASPTFTNLTATNVTATGQLTSSGPTAQVGINRRDTGLQAAAIYSGTGDLQFFVGAADAIVVKPAGNVIVGTALGTAAGMVDVKAKDGSTNAAAFYASDGTKILVVEPDCDLSFRESSSTTANQPQGRIAHLWATSTHASRKGRILGYAADFSGTDREGWRVESDGTQALVGFFGATAIAKPAVTGSRAANAALASLLTALANLGLISDSSSA